MCASVFFFCLASFFFFFFLRMRRPPRSTPFPTRRSSDLPLQRSRHPHVLHETDHVRPWIRVRRRPQRLLQLLDHLRLALEHEHVRTANGCHVQRFVARVQHQNLLHKTEFSNQRAALG